MDQATRDDLRECTELLGHVLPSGGAGEVIAFALRHLVVHLRKRRHATTSRPATPRQSKGSRHVPAHVRRAVHQRDGGACAFVSDDGRRCGSRERVEYDHIVPVARGGEATVDNVRQVCRAHNQYAAERTFGSEFMASRREAARAAAAAAAESQVQADLLAALRALGYRKEQAKYAIARCGAMVGQTLEQQVRRALQQLLPPHQRITRAELAERFGGGADGAQAAPA
jgi:5-methylcytosine-specific restriction endonuclease McrA